MNKIQKFQGAEFDLWKFIVAIDEFIQWLQQERDRQVQLCKILKNCTK